MAHEIQYRSDGGTWWRGHAGVEMRDPVGYTDRLRKSLQNEGKWPAKDVRLVDTETGEILGHPGCSICGEAHLGPDGGCLI